MTFAGSFGVPRRHWDISFTNAPFDVQFSPAVDVLLALVALGIMVAMVLLVSGKDLLAVVGGIVPPLQAIVNWVPQLTVFIAALLAAAILANGDEKIRAAVDAFRAAQTDKVLAQPDPRNPTIAT